LGLVGLTNSGVHPQNMPMPSILPYSWVMNIDVLQLVYEHSCSALLA